MCSRAAGFVMALVAIACTERAPPALLLEIRSPLGIPDETNGLVARVMGGGAVLKEESYTLGTAPRDRWPQTLPILAGEASPKEIDVVLELRRAVSSAPADVVGFAVAKASFPETGELRLEVDVPRACLDFDGDGFGVGLGCRGDDCDDSSGAIPDPQACLPPPDAGPGVDAAPDDAGPGRDALDDADAGVADVAPELADAGPPPPDAGSCGNQGTCEPDQVCFYERCSDTCERAEDCGDPNLICLPNRVCFCRVPCQRADACGPYACTNGCCQFN